MCVCECVCVCVCECLSVCVRVWGGGGCDTSIPQLVPSSSSVPPPTSVRVFTEPTLYKHLHGKSVYSTNSLFLVIIYTVRVITAPTLYNHLHGKSVYSTNSL